MANPANSNITPTPLHTVYKLSTGLTRAQLNHNPPIAITGEIKTIDRIPGITVLGIDDNTLDVRFESPMLVVVTKRTKGSNSLDVIGEGRRIYATGVVKRPRIRTTNKQVLVVSADMILIED